MSTHADTVREALDYLHERADLYDLSLGVNEPLIETTGQYADGLAALDRLAAAEARAEELAEALKRYGRHDERCTRYQHDWRVRFRDSEPTCLCGYEAALAAVTPPKAAEC